MDSSILGLTLDSSVLIDAERRNLSASQTIVKIRQVCGETPVVISSVTVAEIGHGIYRANSSELRTRRREFLDELKDSVPVYPFTTTMAEIVARVGGLQAAKGITLQLADLMIGACALELGYAVCTINLRDFSRIPGLTVVTL